MSKAAWKTAPRSSDGPPLAYFQSVATTSAGTIYILCDQRSTFFQCSTIADINTGNNNKNNNNIAASGLYASTWKSGSVPNGPVYLSIMLEPAQRLRRAIHANDSLLVQRILKSHPALLHGPDTSPAGLSNSNLHLAASLGCLDICRVLVANGHEDPAPALNENHQTALMLAAAAGHTEVVHLLAENDPISISRRDVRGRDAVMEASLGGHDTALQILLTFAPAGATAAVQSADVDGNTALHFASSNGNLLVLRTLLAAGADADKRNIWSWKAVAYSATVQAEVYLKNLVGDIEKRRRAISDADDSRKGAAVRLVEHDVSPAG